MARIICFYFCVFIFHSSIRAQDNITQLQNQIDSLVHDAIDSMAFPGAQVLVLKNGHELLHKSYGYHTYARERKVKNNHLYDLASVTKVMAGGLALMKMQEDQLFHPSMSLSETHPYFKDSDKETISWKSILAHQSRMQPYIVFWQTAKRKNGSYKWRTFSSKKKQNYTINIDNHLKLHKRYPRQMRKMIKNSTLNEEAKYLYSGLGFLLIPDLVFRKTGQCLDSYLKNKIYAPLNIDRITFNPSQKFPMEEIVPTELDTFFRHKLVHGFVHDENASMLNGVSANAGLFANAASLGKIANWLLHSDDKLISQEIINEYTSVQFLENNNRRGLAFDKPLLEYDAAASYIAKSASPSSYGHSGFTGTFIWIDPLHDLSIIFLSNRVYPYRSQRKLYSMNFRPKLHQTIYNYVLAQEK